MWTIVVTIRDSEGNLSNATFYLPASVLYGDAASAADDIADMVGALSTGIVAGWTLSQTQVRSAAVPAGNVDNEIKASFGFTRSDGGTARVSVPAFNRAKLIANSDEVDRLDAQVVAFVSAVIGNGYTDYRGSDLTALKYAVEAYTKRQR